MTTPSPTNRRRLVRIGIIGSAFAFLLLIFASNRLLYVSHQRFPWLAQLQWNHRGDSDTRKHAPEIVGHRGSGIKPLDPEAEYSYIGNTSAAIQAAIDAKVDWIEIDVRRTLDGKLVLFHDSDLNPKTDLHGTVESKQWDDLKGASLNVADENDRSIPLLRDVLTRFHANNRRWILDIKVDPTGNNPEEEAETIRSAVVNLLNKLAIPSRQILIFGDRLTVEAFQGQGYRRGYTTLYRTHRSMLLSHSSVIKRCKDMKCDLMVVPIIFVTSHLVKSAASEGIEVWSYDSDDPRDLKYSVACGVTGLIVDAPNEAVAQFRLLDGEAN